MPVNVRDAEEFRLVRARLSPARLHHYLVDCAGDYRRTLDLYEWNARLAGALLIDIGHVEVALRNTLDTALQARHRALALSGTWLDDPKGALGRDRRGPGRHDRPYVDVEAARRRVRAQGKPLTHDQVVSETGLGLWHQLVSKRHNALWPDLARAFPGAHTRARTEVADHVSSVRSVRNRIGHHHRVYALNLDDVVGHVSGLARCIDPAFAEWIAVHSSVDSLRGRQP